MAVIDLNSTARIYKNGDTPIDARRRGSVLIWQASPPAPARPFLADTDTVAFSSHSFLDTATGITGFHGGNFAAGWTGDAVQTYWGGSYLSYRWGMNGPDRTAEAYDAIMFTEMADFATGYADPASAEGISTLQYAFWHVLTAQAKGAQFACLFWGWSPGGTDPALDTDTMRKCEYVRQWLNARPEITIPVYSVPTPFFIREAAAISAVYNPAWNIFADEVGHLNSSWQEVDEGLSALIWMMLRGVKYPDDVGRSAFLQALIDMGWNMLNAYACTGFGGATVVTPFSVSSDPLPNPAPLEGGTLTAPSVTTQPSFAPATADLDDLVTLFLGSASGNPTPTATWTLTRGATDISAQVSGSMDIVLSVAGTYTLAVTWTNSEGSAVATAATITVSDGSSPISIEGGEGQIIINSMTTPDPFDVTGGEGQITLIEEAV